MYPQLFDRRSLFYGGAQPAQMPARPSQAQGLPAGPVAPVATGPSPQPVAPARPSPQPVALAAPSPQPVAAVQRSAPCIFRHRPSQPGYIPNWGGIPTGGELTPLLLMKLGCLAPVALFCLAGGVRHTITIFELRGFFGDLSSYEVSGIDPASGWFTMSWTEFSFQFRVEFLLPLMR